MINPKYLDQKAEALNAQLHAKYGQRGKTLEAQLKSVGRLLPKSLRNDGQKIVEAQRMARHPKLAASVDETKFHLAYSNITNHLKNTDPKDRRKGKLLGWLGGQVVNLMLVAGVVISVLLWRGFVG